MRALEEGADDCVVKPAKQRELIARVSAAVRRATAVEEGQSTIEHDPFRIDLNNRSNRTRRRANRRDAKRIRTHCVPVSKYRKGHVASANSQKRLGPQPGHQYAHGRYTRQPYSVGTFIGSRHRLEAFVDLPAWLSPRENLRSVKLTAARCG